MEGVGREPKIQRLWLDMRNCTDRDKEIGEFEFNLDLCMPNTYIVDASVQLDIS